LRLKYVQQQQHQQQQQQQQRSSDMSLSSSIVLEKSVLMNEIGMACLKLQKIYRQQQGIQLD